MKQIVENISSSSSSYLSALCPPVKPDQRNPKFSIQLGFTLQTTTALGLKLISCLERRSGDPLQSSKYDTLKLLDKVKLEMMAKLNHPAQGSGVHFILNYFYYQHYLQTYSCNFHHLIILKGKILI